MSEHTDRFIRECSSTEKRTTKFNFERVSCTLGTKRNYEQVLSFHLGFNSDLSLSNKIKRTRYISNKSNQILDAPDLIDDYYLNLLDWSSTNILAVALGNKVYTYDVSNQETQYLCSYAHNYTSLSWSSNSSHIAIGTNNGEIHIIDVSTKICTNVFKHDKRIPALSWNCDILSSGCRDGIINNWDRRMSHPCIATMRSHEQEICGLKWNPSGTQLASGSNDNILCIWDASYRQLHRINAHEAAVKALAWCPWKNNLLASGGGTADRCIKFWNTVSGEMMQSIDTNSQVSALIWNPHGREILSSHGFMHNQLCLWEYPTMTKIQEFSGHEERVLHMALSPDGSSVVSASSDQTLRFWKPFGNVPKNIFARKDDNVRFTNIR
jgi:cell division cycle protein 20 (cofactor of APC complex)